MLDNQVMPPIRYLGMWAALALAAIPRAPGQTAPRLEFEVASIKRSPPQPPRVTNSRTSVDRVRALYTNVTLKYIISRAYRIVPNRIFGPEWINTERFDIEAAIPATAPADSVPTMLQSLLADRVQFTSHRETKEMSELLLTVAKGGSKLKPADSSTGITSRSDATIRRLRAQTSMGKFAEYLSENTGQPVVDGTGLNGAFEFALEWSPVSADRSKGGVASSLFTAVQEQLGLRLEARKAPVEILVIDRVERPSEN